MAKVDMPNKQQVPEQYGMKKKPSLDRKLKEVFITDTPGSVGEHILWDVMIPGLKSMFLSALHGMVDGVFGGRSGGWYGSSGPSYGWGGGTSYRYGGSRTDYSGYSQARKDDYGYQNQMRRRRYDDTEYMFYTYGAACDKKNEIAEFIERKGKISITDVRVICLPPNQVSRQDYMGDNWGWYDILSAQIRMVPHYFDDGRDGWCLELPEPVYFR